MHDNDNLPPLWNPEPVKLVVVEQPEPDEDEERQEFLAAIEAAKDDGTELITTERNVTHIRRAAQRRESDSERE